MFEMRFEVASGFLFIFVEEAPSKQHVLTIEEDLETLDRSTDMMHVQYRPTELSLLHFTKKFNVLKNFFPYVTFSSHFYHNLIDLC